MVIQLIYIYIYIYIYITRGSQKTLIKFLPLADDIIYISMNAFSSSRHS